MVDESEHALSPPRPHGEVRREALAILIAGMSFFLFASLGIGLTRQAGNIALFWPANAVAVALLIRHGGVVLLAGLVAIFAANVAANFAYGDQLSFAAALSFANLAEIAACIFLLKRLDLRALRNSDPYALYSFIRCVAVATIVGSLIGGSLIAYSFDAPLVKSLLTWWVVDFVSGALVLAAMLSWPGDVWREKLHMAFADITPGRVLEFAAAGGLTLAALAILTSVDVSVVTGFSPFLLWVALRYGVFVTSLFAVLIGLGFVSVASGALPLGLLDLAITPHNVVAVQTALILIAVPALFVSAVIRALDRARLQLEEKQVELLRTNKGLKEFNFFASHDLQEPLRKISTSVSILHQEYADKIDGNGQHLLKVMADAAANMRSLIVDLLQFSKFENAKIVLKEVQLDAVVETVKGNLASDWSESGAQLTVSPLPRVWADVRQVEQLFQNLFGNSLKYRHPDRRLDISVTYSPPGHNDSYGSIVVCDNGIGFDDTYAEAIFEPFKRLHSRTEIAGSGIGLAICRAVCEQHGWTISASAKDGEGAAFTITIPRGSIIKT